MSKIHEIQIQQLTKSYANQLVLDRLDFTFLKNHIYIIKGLSGVGKTTLINLIGLIDLYDAGDILYDGVSFKGVSNSKKLKFMQDNISYLFQGTNLHMDLTVYDNLSFVNKHMDTLLAITKALEVDQLLDSKTIDLSKGEKARVSVAKVLLENKSIILMDEPAANLDNHKAIQLYKVIQSYAQDKIVIIVSHERQLAYPIEYDSITIDHGKLQHEHHPGTQPINTEIQSDKGNRCPLIKVSFSLFKHHIGKMMLILMTQMILSFMLIISTTSITIHESHRVIEALKESQLYYVQSDHTNKANIEYLSLNLSVKHNDEYIYLNTYFSEDNSFIFDYQTFQVSQNQAIIPKYIQNLYGITVGSNIYVNDVAIEIIDVYEDQLDQYQSRITERFDANLVGEIVYSTVPVLMSNDVIKSTVFSKTIINDDITFNHLEQEIQTLSGLYTSVKSITFDTNTNSLSHNEVIVVMSDFIDHDRKAVLNQLIDQSILVQDSSDHDDFALFHYLQSMTVKSILYVNDLDIGSVKVIFSEQLKQNISMDIFHNHWLDNETVMLPIVDQLNMDISRIQLNTYDYVPHPLMSFYSLNASIKPLMYLTTTILLIISIFLYWFGYVGWIKSYKKHNFLFQNIGISWPLRAFTLMSPLLLITALGITLSVVLSKQSILLKPMNEAFGLTDQLITLTLNPMFILVCLFSTAVMVCMGFVFVHIKTSNLLSIIKE